MPGSSKNGVERLGSGRSRNIMGGGQAWGESGNSGGCFDWLFLVHPSVANYSTGEVQAGRWGVASTNDRPARPAPLRRGKSSHARSCAFEGCLPYFPESLPNGVAVSLVAGRAPARDWLHFCHVLLVMGPSLTVRLLRRFANPGPCLCRASVLRLAPWRRLCTLYMNRLFDETRRWFTSQISECKREHEISFEYFFAFPFLHFWH